MRIFAVAIFAFVLAGCGGQTQQARPEAPPPGREEPVVETKPAPEEAPAPEPAEVSFSKDVQPILTASCIACHSPSGSAAKYDLTSYDRLARLVVGGNADASKFFTVMQQGRMPPSGKLEQSKLDLIRDWITRGAKDN